MNYLFPYDNVIVGILILSVGFIFHWIGQFISVVNWRFAVRLGLQEKKMPKEYKVYEHAIAVSDVLVGWIYGIAGLGLILNLPWAYKMAFIPGSILLYHSLGYWFWNLNQIKEGNKLNSLSFRIGWALSNFITGILALLWRDLYSGKWSPGHANCRQAL